MAAEYVSGMLASECDSECLPTMSVLHEKNENKQRSFFSPLTTDIDPAPGVTQAVLQTSSRVNGNKILLTRLSFIAFPLFSSHSRLSLRAP